MTYIANFITWFISWLRACIYLNNPVHREWAMSGLRFCRAVSIGILLAVLLLALSGCEATTPK